MKQGVEPKDLKANARSMGHPPQAKGANRRRQVEIDKMIEEYWKQFGWDEQTGKPTRERLIRLGIGT